MTAPSSAATSCSHPPVLEDSYAASSVAASEASELEEMRQHRLRVLGGCDRVDTTPPRPAKIRRMGACEELFNSPAASTPLSQNESLQDFHLAAGLDMDETNAELKVHPPDLSSDPVALDCVSHWRDRLLNSLETFSVVSFDDLRLQRPLHVATSCSGAGTPVFALNLLGFPVRELVAADPKASSFKMMRELSLWMPQPEHHLDTMRDVIAKEGKCKVHEGHCSLGNMPAWDVFVAGFPCAPFSSLRSNVNRCSWRQHSEIQVMFNVAECIREQEPRLAILENVPGFLNASSSTQQQTLLSEYHSEFTEDSPMHSLLAAINAGTSGEAPRYMMDYRMINSDVWLDVPRDRLYIFLVHSSLKSEVLETAMSLVDAVLEECRRHPVFGMDRIMLPGDSALLAERLASVQAGGVGIVSILV